MSKERRTLRTRKFDTEIAIEMRDAGKSYDEIAQFIGINKSLVTKEIKRYECGDFDGLTDSELSKQRFPNNNHSIRIRVVVIRSCTDCLFCSMDKICCYPDKEHRASFAHHKFSTPPDCPLIELTVSLRGSYKLVKKEEQCT